MPTPYRRRVAVTLAASLWVAFAGCSDGARGKVAEVEGTVKLDDSPLANVSVQFLPEDNSLPGSTGSTDDKGHFVLRTADNRGGAVVSKHKVVVRGERGDERTGAKGSPRPVPVKYTQATADNPLGVVEVSESKKSGYDFDLRSK